MLDNLVVAPIKRLATLLLLGTILVCPGALWLVLFSPQLFAEISTVKLFLLSAAISTPVFALNGVIGMLAWMYINAAQLQARSKQNPDPKAIFTPEIIEYMYETGGSIGAVLSIIPLYVPLLMRVLFPAFSLQLAVVLVTLIQMGILSFFGVQFSKARRSRAEQTAPTT